MRGSSRRVPTVPPAHRTGWLRVVASWIAGLVFVCAVGVLLVQHPLAVGAVALALVVSGMWSTRRERSRLVALGASRRSESICGFARSFDARSIDPLVIRTVYQQLQDELRSYRPDFPVRASDRLKEDLGIDGDDLDMSIAPAVALRTGRSMDAVESNPYYGRVKTASDLVHFFNLQPNLDPVT